MQGHQIIEILRKKLKVDADYKLGEKLDLDKSEISRVRKGQSAKKILKKVEEIYGVELLEELQAGLSDRVSSSVVDSDQRLLSEKERVISIQQQYINSLERQVEDLREEIRQKTELFNSSFGSRKSWEELGIKAGIPVDMSQTIKQRSNTELVEETSQNLEKDAKKSLKVKHTQ